jgi:hypothetical protein
MFFLQGCVTKAVTGAYESVTPDKVETFIDDKVLLGQQGFSKLINPSYGYTYFLIALEINSNISSLVIDKTKEKITSYDVQVLKKLKPGSFFFVIPPKVSNGETYEYDEEMGSMIRNYLTVAKYGLPVTDARDAEYIVVTNINESLSKFYGTNYSTVSLSIMDKFDLPIFLADIRVESKSDRNFWYYETKKARPVDQLTMKGLTKIMADGLPKVHGEEGFLTAYAKKKLAEYKEK